jgi:uncharacterized protein (TIGR02453 family)
MKKPAIILDVPPPAMPFEGFSEATFKFLHGLKKNNNKAWFEAHRVSYEADLREPCKLLVEEMAEVFAEAKLPLISNQKRSLFRINRDIRFSKDKSPYKTHIGIVFPQDGAKEDEWSGMYFGFEPDGKNGVKCYIGGGAYMPSSPYLKRIRKKIGTEYKELGKRVAEKNFKKEFPKGITGESLKRIPHGYEEDHPAATLLKLKSFTFGADLPKDDLLNPKLSKILLAKFKAAMPVLQWFAEA